MKSLHRRKLKEKGENLFLAFFSHIKSIPPGVLAYG